MRKLSISLLAIIAAAAIFVIDSRDPAPANANSCVDTPFTNGCYAGISAVDYQQALDEMLLHPEPAVQVLPPNERELNRFDFRRLTNPNGTTIYDAPGGNPISSIAPGFTYISAGQTVEGWIEINPGQWVQAAGTTFVEPSTFSGVLMNNGELPYTMAWVLYPVQPSAYPGGPAVEENSRINRYTRLYIYREVEIDGWRWYLIGPDQWIKQVHVGKILPIERPEGIKGRWISVDLYEQVLVAYEEDIPVFATLISSGLPQWETNEGTFTTWARIANAPMSGAEGQEDFYSLENVPWTLYYDNDISIHGTYWHDSFGYRHSHGCVNMTLTDSHWLFHWTQEAGYDLPQVHVWASGEYR